MPYYYKIEDKYIEDMASQLDIRGHEGWMLIDAIYGLNKSNCVSLFWISSGGEGFPVSSADAWPPTT
jgi:hypothetical protein